MNYSSGGKKDIKNHSKNKKHVQMVNLRKTNTTLPSTLSLKSSVQSLKHIEHIEQLLNDLRTDMEWSTDLREYLKEICFIFYITQHAGSESQP